MSSVRAAADLASGVFSGLGMVRAMWEVERLDGANGTISLVFRTDRFMISRYLLMEGTMGSPEYYIELNVDDRTLVSIVHGRKERDGSAETVWWGLYQDSAPKDRPFKPLHDAIIAAGSDTTEDDVREWIELMVDVVLTDL